MARPLSNDLRERAVKAVECRRELPCCGGAVRCCGVVGREVVAALSRDGLGGAGQDGRSPQAGSGAASRVHHGADQADAASDAARAEGRTCRARRESLAQCGMDVPATRRTAVQKKHCSPLSRAAPTSHGGASAGDLGRIGLDPSRLVFIDETWIKTNMAPLRGWGSKGERLRGFAPHGHWRTLTFLGALRSDQLTAPCVFDGPINGESFRAYVEQQLVQSAQTGRHRHHGQSR